MKTNDEIAGRLKRLREEKKLSQKNLAVLCGWASQSRIGNYEAGTRSISVEDAETLARVLGTSAEHLLFGNDPGNGTLDGQGVPVLGEIVLDAEGYAERVDFADGWLRAYSADREAYALRVKGDSLWPRICAGEYLLIEPGTEVHPGDEVFVRTTAGQSMVRLMTRARDGAYHLSSVTGGHQPLTLSPSEIEQAQFIAAIVKATRYIDENKEK